MPATAAPQTLEYTRAEYLALDEAAPEGCRWEYDGARVYLMAGATPEHNQLSHNISRKPSFSLATLSEKCSATSARATDFSSRISLSRRP